MNIANRLMRLDEHHFWSLNRNHQQSPQPASEYGSVVPAIYGNVGRMTWDGDTQHPWYDTRYRTRRWSATKGKDIDGETEWR